MKDNYRICFNNNIDIVEIMQADRITFEQNVYLNFKSTHRHDCQIVNFQSLLLLFRLY